MNPANRAASRPDAAPLLKAQEAAAYLRLSPRHLWTITQRGEVTAIKLGRSVRYALTDLDAYIEQCRRTHRTNSAAV